jgi:hypothetical protein
MMLTLPAPDPREGDRLAASLRAATLVGTDWRVASEGALDEATVRSTVAAHDGTPAPVVDHDAEFRAAVEAATTLAALKAAILGSTGPGAEPRRPTSA